MNLVPVLAGLDPAGAAEFLETTAPPLFEALAARLGENRYCALLTPSGEGGEPIPPGTGSSGSSGSSKSSRSSKHPGYPVPWALSEIGRRYLRLRDEKLRLFETPARHMQYLLHFHQIPEEREPYFLTPTDFRACTPAPVEVPAWLVPRPPPRTRGEKLHPAKFPETLIDEFVTRFTRPGEVVFDPMMGTGSAVISALQNQRAAWGVELNAGFLEIAKARVKRIILSDRPDDAPPVPPYHLIQGDATRLGDIPALEGLRVDYCVTSPPYWAMLRRKGSEYQRSRRKANLKTTYSEDDRDVGNIADYHEFLDAIVAMYRTIGTTLLAPGGYFTVVLKYIKKNHLIYGLPRDLAYRLCGPAGPFEYAGTTFWCQDDAPLRPFAIGIYWLSNTLHQYCVHFRRPPNP